MTSVEIAYQGNWNVFLSRDSGHVLLKIVCLIVVKQGQC